MGRNAVALVKLGSNATSGPLPLSTSISPIMDTNFWFASNHHFSYLQLSKFSRRSRYRNLKGNLKGSDLISASQDCLKFCLWPIANHGSLSRGRSFDPFLALIVGSWSLPASTKKINSAINAKTRRHFPRTIRSHRAVSAFYRGPACKTSTKAKAKPWRWRQG